MARKKSIKGQAEHWKGQGERLLLTDSEEQKGVGKARAAQAILGLMYIAYGEGMMEAKYGHPSKWPDSGDSYMGDLLFDSDIDWIYVDAILKGKGKR